MYSTPVYLDVPTSVAAGASSYVASYVAKTVAISGTFVATLKIQGRIDPGDWHDIVDGVTGPALIPISHDPYYEGGFEYALTDLRVVVTDYTSGAPVAVLLGADQTELLDAWNRELGTRQGSAPPVGWTPVDGARALVIGFDLPGHTEVLKVGDFSQYQQSVVLPGAGVQLVRCNARMRGPAEIPPGLAWRASLRIDGVRLAERIIRAGATRDLSDMAASVATLVPGTHMLGFRLEVLREFYDASQLYDDPVSFGDDIYELELPAFYVDSVVEDVSASGLSLINRDPEPNESGILATSDVAFDLVCLDTVEGVDGGVPVSGSLRVDIAGVPAVVSGVAQPGFSLATSFPQVDTLRVLVTRAAPFVSSETVPVRVICAATGAASPIDAEYTFTVVDSVGPALVSAVATGLRSIRATFNEPVDGSALVASNWGIVRWGDYLRPVVSARVIAASRVTDSIIDLTTDISLTPAGTYQLSATSVLDLIGNPVAVPSAMFTGWEPPKPLRRAWDLYRMLPQMNRDEDASQDLRRFIGCLQEVADLAIYDVDRFVEISDPDLAGDAYLIAMLRDLGDPFGFDLSTLEMRKLLRVLVNLYRLKGTAPGIKQAVLFFLDLAIEIVPYGDLPGGMELGSSDLGSDWELGTHVTSNLYSFDVVSPVALSAEARTRLRSIVEYAKPAHTHFVKLVEPTIPIIPDHVELGLSTLDDTWILHV